MTHLIQKTTWCGIIFKEGCNKTNVTHLKSNSLSYLKRNLWYPKWLFVLTWILLTFSELCLKVNKVRYKAAQINYYLFTYTLCLHCRCLFTKVYICLPSQTALKPQMYFFYQIKATNFLLHFAKDKCTPPNETF